MLSKEIEAEVLYQYLHNMTCSHRDLDNAYILARLGDFRDSAANTTALQNVDSIRRQAIEITNQLNRTIAAAEKAAKNHKEPKNA